MQINVASLLKEPTGATREYSIDDDLRTDAGTWHVTGHARLDRTVDGVLARSSMRGEASGECSRCLQPLTFPVEVELAEEWIPTVDVDTGARVEPPEGEPDAYRISPRHMLNLGEAAAQYWSMALPMAPLCEESCAGLCPVCGQPVGTDEHGCAREQADDRWAKLAELELAGS